MDRYGEKAASAGVGRVNAWWTDDWPRDAERPDSPPSPLSVAPSGRADAAGDVRGGDGTDMWPALGGVDTDSAVVVDPAV